MVVSSVVLRYWEISRERGVYAQGTVLFGYGLWIDGTPGQESTLLNVQHRFEFHSQIQCAKRGLTFGEGRTYEPWFYFHCPFRIVRSVEYSSTSCNGDGFVPPLDICSGAGEFHGANNPLKSS